MAPTGEGLSSLSVSEQQNQGAKGLDGSPLGGAAAGAAVMLGGGTVAALVGPVGADVLRMQSSPVVGTQRGVVGATGKQSVQHVLEVSPYVQVVPESVSSN
ncbi:MAG: hypothetical protein ACYC35_22825 [Pirellulales bacterium]